MFDLSGWIGFTVFWFVVFKTNFIVSVIVFFGELLKDISSLILIFADFFDE